MINRLKSRHFFLYSPAGERKINYLKEFIFFVILFLILTGTIQVKAENISDDSKNSKPHIRSETTYQSGEIPATKGSYGKKANDEKIEKAAGKYEYHPMSKEETKTAVSKSSSKAEVKQYIWEIGDRLLSDVDSLLGSFSGRVKLIDRAVSIGHPDAPPNSTNIPANHQDRFVQNDAVQLLREPVLIVSQMAANIVNTISISTSLQRVAAVFCAVQKQNRWIVRKQTLF